MKSASWRNKWHRNRTSSLNNSSNFRLRRRMPYIRSKPPNRSSKTSAGKLVILIEPWITMAIDRALRDSTSRDNHSRISTNHNTTCPLSSSNNITLMLHSSNHLVDTTMTRWLICRAATALAPKVAMSTVENQTYQTIFKEIIFRTRATLSRISHSCISSPQLLMVLIDSVGSKGIHLVTDLTAI